MRVLGVGFGAGDVSVLLAELVGPDGAVVGVDVDPVVLELARAQPRPAWEMRGLSRRPCPACGWTSRLTRWSAG